MLWRKISSWKFEFLPAIFAVSSKNKLIGIKFSPPALLIKLGIKLSKSIAKVWLLEFIALNTTILPSFRYCEILFLSAFTVSSSASSLITVAMMERFLKSFITLSSFFALVRSNLPIISIKFCLDASRSLSLKRTSFFSFTTWSRFNFKSPLTLAKNSVNFKISCVKFLIVWILNGYASLRRTA